MSQVEAEVGTEQIPQDAEPLFGTLDIFFLIGLIVLGAWWLLKNKKNKEESSSIGRSYSIQYVSINIILWFYFFNFITSDEY